EQNRTAVVQAGTVLDELNKATRRHGGLVFGPKPATHNHCTIGGMLGNDSCGSTAQWSGTTGGNVRRLEILTYDGTRMWVGPTSDAEYRSIVDGGGRPAGFPAIATAGDRVRLVNRFQPYILEGLDHRLIEYENDRRMNTVTIHEIPPAGAWLMVKLTGDSTRQARDRAEEVLAALRDGG